MGVETNGDATADLTMTPGHVYSVPAYEDTWFNINQDTFNFRDGWSNQDSDGSERTFALLTPVLNNGDDSANGSQFSYNNGTTTVTLTYTGTALAIPVEYLDTVQFKAAANISGSFKIEVEAKTVDTDPNNPAVTDTAISGSATLTNLVVQPVADQVTLSVSSPATGLEDNQIPIHIRPTSSDPSRLLP